MGLVSEAIEEEGIPTVTLAMERGVAAPRVAFVPFPYNFPMGEPNERGRHKEIALAALRCSTNFGSPVRSSCRSAGGSERVSFSDEGRQYNRECV